jgi:hypothetical protein
LDATFFKTQSHALEATVDNSQIGELYFQLYANLKDHLMNNDEKPTAQPAAGRIPPFGLDIDLPNGIGHPWWSCFADEESR